jgi:uncharacterized protein YjbI with pentapeptide repeats
MDAQFPKAQMEKANLDVANLEGSNLTGASNAQFEPSTILTGTVMPDGTSHP